jgi:hypothetical protein
MVRHLEFQNRGQLDVQALRFLMRERQEFDHERLDFKKPRSKRDWGPVIFRSRIVTLSEFPTFSLRCYMPEQLK